MSLQRLGSNENPFGAGAEARAAVQSVPLGLYPDAAMLHLRQQLAKHYGLELEQVCVGAGSTDLIFHLVASLAGQGEILAPRHSFVAYRLAARSAGASYVETGSGIATDLDALAQRVSAETRLVCVVNPANPTGAFLEPQALVRFLEQLPAGLPVILDEAYAEYVSAEVGCEGPALLTRFPHVITLRTFSKAYGLAGLRVGYALGNPAWLKQVEMRRPPFSVGSPALAAAAAALDDQAHVEASVLSAKAERERLALLLRAKGLEVLPSEGNFLCVQVGDSVAVARALLKQGIEVMPLGDYGLPEWMRVTVGHPAQNELFVAAMRERTWKA